MKGLIFYSFGTFPGQPYFFAANVTGYLKHHGVNVVNYDANLEVWKYILSPAFLATIEYNPRVFRAAPFFLAADISFRKFEILKQNVLDQIEKALSILKDKQDFYDIRKLNWAHYIIYRAQQLIYYQYGTFIGFRTVFWPNIGFKIKAIDDIFRLSLDKVHNPFIDIFQKTILPHISAEKPGIIGTEMFFPWEIVQVLTLNLLIKEQFPGIHLNFLGQGFDEINFARIADNLKQDERFMFGFDTVFMARNNAEVHKLYALEGITPAALAEINSLSYRIDGRVAVKGPFNEGDMNFDIFPDYGDLPLGDYFTPYPVFVDKLSSRCFWSQCSYCSINAYKAEQQIADLNLYIKRIRHFSDTYGCRHLWLLDEATPPGIIDNFSGLLLKEKIDIIWSVRTRIDKKLDAELLKKMHQAGCRELWIGLESVSPSLLKDMNKTSEPELYPRLAAELMNNCNKIGIGVHFCIFIGFPTETVKDKKLLLDFFRTNEKFMDQVPYFATFNEFWLMKDSEVYRNPAKYGIEKIIDRPDHYNMVDVPFQLSRVVQGRQDALLGIHSGNTEKFAKELLNFFVRDKVLTLLWFNSSDSYHELLLKEKYQTRNPFRRRMRWWEGLLMFFVLKFDNSPLFSGIIKRRFLKYAGIKMQEEC